MTAFSEGYDYAAQHLGSQVATGGSDRYVAQVEDAIETLRRNLNAFEGFKTKPDTLKGDVAEFWHAGTFNIDAKARGSSNEAFVNRSHDFASADISTNFEKIFGLKYYKTGEASAKQQAKSVFERFYEYRAGGGKDDINAFLEKRGFSDSSVLHDPIYQGQIRVIPKDQIETAIAWLEQKIAKESANRPEQVTRYQETLSMLSDRLKDNCGTESVPLSEADAKALAVLAKEGDVTAEQLKRLGISADEVIRFEYLAKQAFQSGLTAATFSVVLKTVPEIYKAISSLIENGKISRDQFRRIGFAAASGSAEGFIRGTVAAAITTACKSGMLGETAKSISPSIIGMATVLALNTMKNAFDVAYGRKTRAELAQELTKELIISSFAIAGGTITQGLIEIPVLGFMLGSFLGSVVGSFAYNCGYRATMSFCTDTGFTMFGLVKQDYTLPEEALEYIGVDVFRPKKFQPHSFQPHTFKARTFTPQQFEPKTLEIYFLRRGVIGVSEIGYIA